MATRWFSDSKDEDTKGDSSNKDDDFLDAEDLDELAEWLGDEALPSEMPELADFFKGEAAERYTQYANETYAETYDSVYEDGPSSEDNYVPFDEWVMAKEASFKFSDDHGQAALRNKMTSYVPELGEDGADEDQEPPEYSFAWKPRDPPMDDTERGIVESRAKFRRAKGKKLAYDKWKQHCKHADYLIIDGMFIVVPPPFPLAHCLLFHLLARSRSALFPVSVVVVSL